MTIEQQGLLLDRISAGMCVFGVCGRAGQHRVEMTWLINAGSIRAATLFGPQHLVTLSVLICDGHHRHG